MRRWPEDDRGHLRLDARYPAYLAEKLRLLAEDPGGCRVFAPQVDREGLERALVRVAEALAGDALVHPAAATAPGTAAPGTAPAATPAPLATDARSLRFPLLGLALDRRGLALQKIGIGPAEGRDADAGPVPAELKVRARRHLEGLPPLERLADALALAVQEDLVVMRDEGGPAGDMRGGPARGAPGGVAGGRRDGPSAGEAELLHVCFPSAWDPRARAGADFAALHAPVPHGEVLQRSAPQVVRAMVAKGPFVRYVWSLAPDARLDRNPRRHPDPAATVGPESMWFRVERQTVMPLPELQRALFTIRVYMAPLASVAVGAERRRTLASAVASMDEALLAYKGIGEGRDALLAWLEAGDPTAS